MTRGHTAVICRYLSDAGAPWILGDNHLRKRNLRRLAPDIADPTLMIRYLMAERPH
jgi:hypothetical protein